MGREEEERRCVWAEWMMLGMRKDEEERVDGQQQRRRGVCVWGGVILGRGAAVVDGGRHDVCFHGDGLSVSYT